MICIRDTKELVRYRSRVDPGGYFVELLLSSIRSRFGDDDCEFMRRELRVLSLQLSEFKAGQRPAIQAPLIADSYHLSDKCRIILRSFYLSAKAYEVFRLGSPSGGMQMLRESMELDAEISALIQPMEAHYYQVRHNICRLLAYDNRRVALREYLASTLRIIACKIPASARTDEAVLLELMGVQIMSYYLGLAWRMKKLRNREIELEPRSRGKSHLAHNILFWNCVVRKDAGSAIKLMTDRESFLIGEFRNWIRRAAAA